MLFDPEFIGAALNSPTFWTGVMLPAGSIALVLSVGLALGLRRARLRRFRDDQSGAAGMLEFMLLMPVWLILGGFIVQFLQFAQTNLILHQAAYSAARSARVHMCPPPNLRGVLQDGPTGLVGLLFNDCDDNRAREKYETAARLALIAASSSKPDSLSRGNCPYPKALIQLTVNTSLTPNSPIRSGLQPALEAKACYAFERDNVEVKVQWEQNLLSSIRTDGPPPITAAVRFRYPINTPTAMWFADGRRTDGSRWRDGHAQMTLL